MRPSRVPVLMLHHVDPKPLEPPAVFTDSYLSPDELEALLDHLKAWGCSTLTVEEVASAWRKGASLPRRTVALTFDDAGRGVLTHALPALTRRGMKATVYAVSGELAGWNRWDESRGERREPLLGASELRALASAGWEIGCHSHSHPRLPGCPSDRLRQEVEEARRHLASSVGTPVTTFCYPYGDLDSRVAAAVQAAGYHAAVSIFGHREALFGDLFRIPRMIVRPTDSSFETRLKALGRYPLWSRLPRLGLLAAVRRSRRPR